MVDHRHIQMALGPQNGVRVGTFPGKVQGLQLRQVIVAHQLALGILALHRANGSRRGEEGADLMFRNHPPEGARIRGAHGLTLKDNRGAARDQGRIADIAVPHDPAHVRGCPKHIARSAIVDRAHRPVQRHQMPGGRAHHALRRTSGARGIKDIGRMVALNRHTFGRLHPILEGMPRHIAALNQLGHFLFALQDYAEVGLVGGHVDSRIQQRFVMHDTGRLDPAAGRDDGLGRAIINPHRQLIGGKATKHHRMDGPKAGAGQHRLHRFGNHRHIDNDPVALRHTLGAQSARKAGHSGLQLGIGDRMLAAGHRAVVDDRHLIAATGLDMTVDRVPAGVDRGVGEPFIKGRAGIVQRL